MDLYQAYIYIYIYRKKLLNMTKYYGVYSVQILIQIKNVFVINKMFCFSRFLFSLSHVYFKSMYFIVCM